MFDRNGIPISGVTVNRYLDDRVVATTVTNSAGRWELMTDQPYRLEFINGATTVTVHGLNEVEVYTPFHERQTPRIPWRRRLLGVGAKSRGKA